MIETNIDETTISEKMVGMGSIKVVRNEGVLWMVLGSCVGVILYDSIYRIGGVAHVMLPKNSMGDPNIYKYADTSVPALIRLMLENGARKCNLTARLVGGANMFKWKPYKSFMNIGDNNIDVVKEVVVGEKIPITKCVVGGNCGYKIWFDVATGDLNIKFSDGSFKKG